jgi:hypothetical protein
MTASKADRAAAAAAKAAGKTAAVPTKAEAAKRAANTGTSSGAVFTDKPRAGDLAAEITAPAVKTPSKAKFVTVASKMPMNIELQLCAPRTARVTGQFGSVEETVFIKHGAVHVIRGTAYPELKPPKGFPKRPDMIEDEKGGYALTPGVPAEFWEKWLEENRDTEMVQNGMIKAQSDLDSLAADAAEHADRDSGLGALNPDGDRRNPKPANSSITAPERVTA